MSEQETLLYLEVMMMMTIYYWDEGNEFSGYIKGGKFHDQPNYCYILRMALLHGDSYNI
jgi:hypothetical protein